MKFNKKVTIKNGKVIYIGNAEAADGSAVLEKIQEKHGFLIYEL